MIKTNIFDKYIFGYKSILTLQSPFVIKMAMKTLLIRVV